MNQLLLLLDGLDEVEDSNRPACITAINAYREEHVMPLVVCSGIDASHPYEPCLTLQSAVIIEPLSAQQVEATLSQAGTSLVFLDFRIP